MKFLIGAEEHLGKTVRARNGVTYDLLVETWDTADGPVPGREDCLAAFVAWETARTAARALSEAMAGTEDLGTLARKLEDILDHLENGKPLPGKAVDWLNDRKGRRGQG